MYSGSVGTKNIICSKMYTIVTCAFFRTYFQLFIKSVD